MSSSNKTKLDRIDKTILNILSNNGRISNQELSEQIGLSPTPCFRRVKALEKSGIISGYKATINEQALGLSVAVFMSVKLERQIASSIKDFEHAISKCPEVVDCWLMTGDNDYLIRVLVASLEDYENFLTTVFTKIPGIASIQSSVSLRRVKSSNDEVSLTSIP